MLPLRRGRVMLSAAVTAAAVAMTVPTMPSMAQADVPAAVFADQVIQSATVGTAVLQRSSDPNTSFSMVPSTVEPGGVRISTGTVTVELAPAPGDSLTTGESLVASYVGGRGAYFAITGQPSTQLSCQSIAVHIAELDRSQTGAITGIAASFHETCPNSSTSDWGDIQYGAAAPFGFVTAQVGAKQAVFPESGVGQVRTQTVTMQNYGTSSVALGTPTISGLGSSAYSVGNDKCSGATLGAGQTCTVDVSFAPVTAGTYWATVSYPTADLPSGAAVVQPYGTAKNPPAAPTLTAYPGDNGIGIAISPGSASPSSAAATGWSIYRDGSDTPIAQLPAKTLTWADEPLTAGDSHSYTAVAQSADGAGSPSQPATAQVGSPQAARGSVNAFTVDTSPADGPPVSRVEAATLQSTTLGAMTFAGQNGDTLTLSSVVGQTRLAPGTYTDPNAPTVLSTYGTACRTTSLVVADADVEADGTPDVVTATYRADCGDKTVSGEIRWHSTLGYRAAATNPDAYEAGSAVVGSSTVATTVTTRNTGTQPISLGSATIDGADASDFDLTSDHCSQQSLAPGDSCQLSVAFAPTASGPRTAALHLPDDTAAGSRLVPLSGNGESLPGRPSSAAATPGAGFVRVYWFAPADSGGTPITAYRIYRGADAHSISAQPIATVPASVESWSDDSVAPGSSYVYAVTAVNAIGEGAGFDAAPVTPLNLELVHSEDLHGFGNESLVVSDTEGGEDNVLVDDGHNNIEPTISPDGKTVAFVSDAGGTDEIWTVPADGSGAPQQITHDPQSDTWPAWSPDGSRIAYTTRQGAGTLTATIRSDGLYETVISGSDNTERPSWSPSGRQLIVGSTSGNLGADVLEVDGTGRRHVVGSDGGQLPQVSPDGRTIALVFDDTDATDACRDSYQQTHLATLPFIGGTPIAVGPGGYDTLDPTWWPSSKTISYDRLTMRNGCLDSSVIEHRDVATGNLIDSTNAGERNDYPALHGPSVEPAAPAAAPGAVTAQLGTSDVTLRWTDPTDAHFWHVVVRRGAAGASAPTTPDAGSAVYVGTGTSVTVKGLEAGDTYNFAVFAVDDAGTPSVAAPAAVSMPYDDRWTGLRYSGRWKAVASKSAWMGTLHEATARGAAVTSTTSAQQFTLIGQTCRGCGTATVYVDGARAGTLSTAAAGTHAGRVLWRSRRFSRPAKHTIRVVADGKAPLWLDAMQTG